MSCSVFIGEALKWLCSVENGSCNCIDGLYAWASLKDHILFDDYLRWFVLRFAICHSNHGIKKMKFQIFNLQFSSFEPIQPLKMCWSNFAKKLACLAASARSKLQPTIDYLDSYIVWVVRDDLIRRKPRANYKINTCFFFSFEIRQIWNSVNKTVNGESAISGQVKRNQSRLTENIKRTQAKLWMNSKSVETIEFERCTVVMMQSQTTRGI